MKDEPHSSFSPGDQVRLRSDPGRIGTITGTSKPGRHGQGHRFQVRFISENKTSWVQDDQIERMPEVAESPLDLLEQKKLSGAIDLRRTLTHARLSGKLADVIYSMEVTNTEYHAFQFKPVVRFLMSPTNGLLIADEVGLGKTIEACLIWTELRSRFDQRRLLILCPAVLREKWKQELKNRIGVNARIVDAEELHKTLRDPAAQLEGFALICSQQGARPDKDWRYTDFPGATGNLARFLDAKQYDFPLIDLLVIDESHYMRNPESQTHEMGFLFRQVSESLVMLSATPIHNKNEDLFALLRLLDSETFTQPDDLTQILDASRPLVKARDELLRTTPSESTVRQHLADASGHRLLRQSEQLRLILEEVTTPGALQNYDKRARLAWRLEQVNPLAYVITRTRKRDVTELRVHRDPVPERVQMHAAEEAAYLRVTQAVRQYNPQSTSSDAFLLAMPQRQMCSSVAATIAAWQKRAEAVDDDSQYEASIKKSSGPLAIWLLSQAFEFGDATELKLVDTKYQRVKERLCEFFADHSAEKVVLFSSFRHTLDYLSERFREDGISSLVLHGGTKQSKDEVLTSFRESEVQILLSSEIGSEGIDLQFCRLLINYDLPWNPMRVEQRIGRLDRIGQRASVIRIWNLFYENTIDDRIYERLYDKLRLCQEALGDFEEVLGTEIRSLTRDLLADRLSAEQEIARIEQTAQSLANLKQEQLHLESEASHLVAYGDYILNQVKAAKEMHRWVTGQDLQTYFTDFFRHHYPGCDLRQVPERSLEWEVRLSDQAKNDLSDFSHSLRVSPGRLVHNSVDSVVCRFENRPTTIDSYGVEWINQFHPVIRFISTRIQTQNIALAPAVAVTVPRGELTPHLDSGTYVLCVDRWYVNGLQDIERLAFAAARLDGPTGDGFTRLSSDNSERLAAACSKSGETWLAAKGMVDLSLVHTLADEVLFAALEDEFEEFRRDECSRNTDRREIRLNNIRLHYEKKRLQLDQTLEKHKRSRNIGLSKITENRIQCLESLVTRQTEKISSRTEVRSSRDEILLAIVQVTE